MYEFHPYFTNDGSVGLYSPSYDDIYHSVTGALTEAYEKFILPIDMPRYINKDSLKILDICYGIGYNSKSFLNFLYNNFSQNNSEKIFNHANNNIEAIYTNKNNKQVTQYNDKIYTNNTSGKVDQNNSFKNNNATIYTNNILPKIYIRAVDNDKILSFLSPFIKTGKKNIQKQNLDFEYKAVNKFLTQNQKSDYKKIDNQINYFLLSQIINKIPEIYDNKDFIDILFSKDYSEYFEPDIKGIFKLYRSNIYKTIPTNNSLPFLHNIYYKYVANCYKKGLKVYPLSDVSFELINGDARKIISNDTNEYDIIFLDAFTPSKCPCLWSLEFFKELYKHLSADGIILTYSTSAAVRAAMLDSGFAVGKIYNERENKFTGTTATKDYKQIKYQLSEYDLGLLKTKAGIFYRDQNLTGLNEAIINTRIEEVKNSNRISSSRYKRTYKQEDSCNTML